MLIIFFSFTYIGYAIYDSKRQRAKRLDGLAALIRFIKQRAECFMEPLDTIYQSFQDDSLNEYGFCDTLIKEGFEFAYNKYEAAFSLDEFTSASIKVFGISLGKLPIEEQLSSCSFILSLLDEKCEEAKCELPRLKKLWCSLGMLAGASIALFLL